MHNAHTVHVHVYTPPPHTHTCTYTHPPSPCTLPHTLTHHMCTHIPPAQAPIHYSHVNLLEPQQEGQAREPFERWVRVTTRTGMVRSTPGASLLHKLYTFSTAQLCC